MLRAFEVGSFDRAYVRKWGRNQSSCSQRAGRESGRLPAARRSHLNRFPTRPRPCHGEAMPHSLIIRAYRNIGETGAGRLCGEADFGVTFVSPFDATFPFWTPVPIGAPHTP